VTPLGLTDVFLDTSVVATALVPGIPHHRACADFCEALRQERTRVVYSQILRLEFVQVWSRLPAGLYLPAEVVRTHRLRAWDRNPSIRVAWMAHGVDQLERFVDRFAESLEIPFNLAIWRASVEVMARHRLRSNDAAHVATARIAGLTDLASVDDDFRRATDLRLWLLRNTGT
jgi:predicted nucleic acid-binding protein